jgi:hypothetical protein
MRFRDPEVGDIVRRRLRAEQEMVSHILLDGAIPVIAPNHRIGQVGILDDCFELPTLTLGDR